MKKLFYTLLLSLMTLSSNAQVMKLGDLNHDNQVNITDVMTLVNNVLYGTSPIFVSFSNVTMNVGSTVIIPSGSGSYDVQSSNVNVASATVKGSTIIFVAVGYGTATITVTDRRSGETAAIEVTVENNPPQAYLTCPDNHHPHLIDLGLPSGTKWACCNVGATAPEDYGGYYAWGETEEKNYYDSSTYQYYQNGSYVNLGSDIAGTQYDVARVKWGGSWVMPTHDQQMELCDNCTYEWTTVNGVKGGKFTSKTNGGIIFLPAAGRRLTSGLDDAGSHGYYWSSTQGPSITGSTFCLYFGSGYTDWSYANRSSGRSVRPVVRN